MFQVWRLKLREAEEAFKAGDLQAAARLLTDELRQYLPGRRLAAKVAAAQAAQAGALAARGELDSGWRELAVARRLAGDTEAVQRVERQLIDCALQEILHLIAVGEPASGLRKIEALEKRRVDSARLAMLKQVAQRAQSASHLARRGKFVDAEAQLVAALHLAPALDGLKALCREYRGKADRTRELTEQLHRHLGEQNWSDVLVTADELLQLSPESPLAGDARNRAWAQVGARCADSPRFACTQPWRPSSHEGHSSPGRAGRRSLLWVDGVGGYLVCLDDEIVIGQAAPGNEVDVAVLADISRRHARIRRVGEGYMLEPLHVVRVNGAARQGKVSLKDGDEIELGAGVHFRFRQPHALSASARLDRVSRHRTQPYADSVLLMAESCVLGPRRQNHVVCPDWSNDVVLYRQDDDLYCRAMDAIEIDGRLCDGRGRVQGNSHIAGGDFSMSLEELDRCTPQPLL